jgi:hypothetical protein
MKILIVLFAIFLSIGSFTLNAHSDVTAPTEQIKAPITRVSGFKKDISVAD